MLGILSSFAVPGTASNRHPQLIVTFMLVKTKSDRYIQSLTLIQLISQGWEQHFAPDPRILNRNNCWLYKPALNEPSQLPLQLDITVGLIHLLNTELGVVTLPLHRA